LKETPNSWLIKEDPYDRNRKRTQENYNKISTNFNVYVCPDCNRVHEVYYFNGSGMQTAYHDDFPKYKLKKYTCVECDGQ
tara:strand:- start:852 stop:1091 length:240 start_codon:yes stop_codon:yes gene_type:complete